MVCDILTVDFRWNSFSASLSMKFLIIGQIITHNDNNVKRYYLWEIPFFHPLAQQELACVFPKEFHNSSVKNTWVHGMQHVGCPGYLRLLCVRHKPRQLLAYL